jgi:hypothetical protein
MRVWPLILVLGCGGCKLPQGDIVSVTQSLIGIRFGLNPQNQTPELQIGFFRSTFQIVPTSTNVVYSPTVNSSLSLDQKSFSSSIDEDFTTGNTRPVTNSVAQRALMLRARPPIVQWPEVPPASPNIPH